MKNYFRDGKWCLSPCPVIYSHMIHFHFHDEELSVGFNSATKRRDLYYLNPRSTLHDFKIWSNVTLIACGCKTCGKYQEYGLVWELKIKKKPQKPKANHFCIVAQKATLMGYKVSRSWIQLKGEFYVLYYLNKVLCSEDKNNIASLNFIYWIANIQLSYIIGFVDFQHGNSFLIFSIHIFLPRI